MDKQDGRDKRPARKPVVGRAADEGARVVPMATLAPGTALRVLAAGTDTGGVVSVLEAVKEPGDVGPPLHRHPGIAEMFYVLEGQASFQVGARRSWRPPAPASSFPADSPIPFATPGRRWPVCWRSSSLAGWRTTSRPWPASTQERGPTRARRSTGYGGWRSWGRRGRATGRPTQRGSAGDATRAPLLQIVR